MLKRIKFFLNIVVLIFCITVNSQITLGPLFSDDMILQRNSEVAIWGLTNPNQKVSINLSWDDSETSAQADKYGNWLINVETPEAGGPYEIYIGSSNNEMISSPVAFP